MNYQPSTMNSPRRIISLVPSQTELLYDLGLGDSVVGITKFCVHPDAWFRSKTRVGGTKQVKMDVIHSLQPDLVLANKEENVKEQVEEIATFCPVYTSDISTLSDAIDMIKETGRLTGREPQAYSIAGEIEKRFAALPPVSSPLTAVYLVWQQPFLCAGGDTFIHAMMEAAGFSNVFAHTSRYPEISADDIRAAAPAFMLLASEPFPFAEKHRLQYQPIFPGSQIILVDGEMFSWYGSRLLHAPDYFKSLREERGK